ncbi:MAG: tryptophan--tRNA ligase [Peptostreptococcaceae bacterium]|nr:tryptophan--tRNA ligase [Peptostreptococcaceae bacterium]
MSEKKIILSGIQPSGIITLGNYLGALTNWVKLQDEYDNYFCIVDLHSVTVPQDPKDLHEKTLLLLSQYLASGIDPNKSTIFIQSHVPQHAELSWVLSTMTYMGELGRMTQYKEKSSKGGENLNSALFTYPVLMAADILLYNAHLVPVGEDQRQHLELTRNVAQRFNARYEEIFNIPEPYIPKVGSKIMDLQDPSKKMSKSSDNPNSFISLMDDDKTIVKKIKRSVTDSLGVIAYNDEQLGIKNLIEIYSTLTGMSVDEIVQKYEGKGYGQFKGDVAEAIIAGIGPVRDKALEYMGDRSYLEKVYKNGAERACAVASKMLEQVYEKVGFVKR